MKREGRGGDAEGGGVLSASAVVQEDRLTCGGESFRQVILSVLLRVNLDCEAGFIFISVIDKSLVLSNGLFFVSEGQNHSMLI